VRLLPLTESVEFKTVLQKGNRIQVPKLVRWQFKMEPTQVLAISVGIEGTFRNQWFYGRMSKDGRITIPKLIMGLLEEKKSLVGCIINVNLEPATSNPDKTS